MNTYADKSKVNASRANSNSLSKETILKSSLDFVTNSSEEKVSESLQETSNSGSEAKQLQGYQEIADSSHRVKELQKIQSIADHSVKQKTQFKKEIPSGKAVQRNENQTGLPDNLKSGIEDLSGYSLNDVKVHYGSDKPSQLQAHAYAQGTEIHIAPGQEKHLAHEAWHVVQQKQGRVKPTMQLKGDVNVNDDSGLENEADLMGVKALKMNTINPDPINKSSQTTSKERSVTSGSSGTVQRTIDHVNQLIERYAGLTGDRTAVGPYGTWTAVLREKRKFSPGQWKKIEMAYRYKADGSPTIVDRSKNEVAEAVSGEPGVDSTVEAIEAKMNALQKQAPVHFAILNFVEDTIISKLGLGANLEFWKGAHIVFSDQGSMYNQLKVMGDPIATKKPDGSIKNKTEFVGLTSFNYFGFGGSTQDQRDGKMMERRPGTKETGHYANTLGGPPQYGIDLPESIKGHLLFGLTGDGDTFVQTEGAGFQSFWEGTVAHGAGALTVRGYTLGSKRGMQTGMVGNSMHSEDPTVQTEIREHDNSNLPWNAFLASIV